MTAISFQDQYGKLDLTLIRDDQVASLDPERRALIHRVIETVTARMKAELRLATARARARDAMTNEDAALEAHKKVNPVPTFQQIRAAAILAYDGVK